MKDFDHALLKRLYLPPQNSHKGQNGKLLVIGGSHLFHAASIWALEIASRLLDMVFYSSVPENNEIIQKAKEEFKNGIVVKREEIDHYINEADCILVGPGMERSEKSKISNFKFQISNIKEINEIKDEGEQTYFLTKYLLEKFPDKRYVLDAGALQMMEPEWLLGLKQTPILTPHVKEFDTIQIKSQNSKVKSESQNLKLSKQVATFAKEYKCIILLKGVEDIVCPPNGEADTPKECTIIKGGNAGMTKGGTGDVLAGLTASLYCKNDSFLSAVCASYINKKAGDSLFEKVGYYFNASDLAKEIPGVMKNVLIK